MFAWEGDRNLVAFKYNGLEARIPIPMPDHHSDEVVRTPVTRETRNRNGQERAYDQAIRQRWRAMLLIVKAKLEAIEAEITTFEQEFLPYFVLPDGRTVSDAMMPGIYGALEAGQMPPMLPDG